MRLAASVSARGRAIHARRLVRWRTTVEECAASADLAVRDGRGPDGRAGLAVLFVRLTHQRADRRRTRTRQASSIKVGRSLAGWCGRSAAADVS